MGSGSGSAVAEWVQISAQPLGAGFRERVAAIAKALADPNRVEILHLLAVADDAVCVLDVEHHLGLAQSTVSYHLKALVDVGVCERDPRGRWTYYRLRRDVLASFRHDLERLVHFPEQLTGE